MKNDQQGRARLFKELHHGARILVLPNAWDAASARVFELAGARAIATTSAGLAATLGYPDGEQIPREQMIAAVRHITATVDLPVSVDAEAGYGATAAAVAETMRAVIEAGGIGVNLEDGTDAPQVLVDKIGATREVANAKGIALFINARTDVYLRAIGTPGERFDETVRRLRAYEAAGADGLFVPGLGDADTIARLLREIRLPLNILAGASVPTPPELERLGVKRVSVGSGPMRATLTLARRIADALLQEGSYAGFLGDTIPHAEVNRMFTRG